MTNNPWDHLTGIFATDGKRDVPAQAADNILIAWPPILEFIGRHAPPGSTVLDFGCGGGLFANELYRRGYRVTGFDTSTGMIRSARAAFGANISFVVGEPGAINTLGCFTAVTSIMTLQFIPDGRAALAALASRVDPAGLLVFAVHDPDHVKERIATGETFVDFDSPGTPRRGTLRFGAQTSVPIYIRTADEYDEWATASGLKPAFRATPPLTEEFLRLYPSEGRDPLAHSGYLILGYLNPDAAEASAAGVKEVREERNLDTRRTRVSTEEADAKPGESEWMQQWRIADHPRSCTRHG